eukprot:11227100-Lingulodinium_polyedra.AAC.2
MAATASAHAQTHPKVARATRKRACRVFNAPPALKRARRALKTACPPPVTGSGGRRGPGCGPDRAPHVRPPRPPRRRCGTAPPPGAT